MPDRQDAINRSMLRAFETLQRIQEQSGEITLLLGEGLRSLALQSDRYDAELAEIRDGLAALDFRLKALEPDAREHSTIVRPFRCVPDESGGARE